jgi:hypothetical protein
MYKKLLVSIFAALLVLFVIASITSILFYRRTSMSDDSVNSTSPKSPNSDTELTVTFPVITRLPGAPNYTIKYPRDLGDPIISSIVNNPNEIDLENNLERIVFYSPGSPHTYPDTDSQFNLSILTGVGSLLPGQTLQEFADAQFSSTPSGKTNRRFTIGGHAAIAQKISPRSAATFYYIKYGENAVLRYILTTPTENYKKSNLKDNVIESMTF